MTIDDAHETNRCYMELKYQGVTLSSERVAQLQALGEHYGINWCYLVTQLWIETQWGAHPQATSARADNNWAGITWGSHVTWNPEVKKTQGLARPTAEGGYYIHYESVSDFFKDWVYLLRLGGNYVVAGATSIEDYTKGLFIAGGAKADYAASGYEHYLNLMRQHFYGIFSKGEDTVGKINTMIQWFKEREGKVTYSMDYRNGPNSYDCSSAVYSALIKAGFLPANTWLGNTETLFALEGKLFVPVQRSNLKPGDIFVAGVKGNSLGAGGHTGVYVGNGKIIHCTYARNGIATTPIDGYTGAGLPVYWYRIKGAESTTLYDAVKKHFVCSLNELRIHSNASSSAEIVDKMTNGVIKNIDRMINADDYVWGSYISYKGDRRYFPIQTVDGSRKFGDLQSGWVDAKTTPAASISQQDGKPKVLDEDYSVVLDGQKWKLVKE